MPLSDSAIALRKKHVGSSDAAAICGVDPFMSPLDVFLSKVYETSQITSTAIEMGDLLQPILIQFVRNRLDVEIEENLVFAKDTSILAANLDGKIKGISEHVEAKTTSLTEGWGDELLPNTVPEKVLIQCHHQFHCADTCIAWVPVLLGGMGGLRLKLYRVERNERLVDAIVERCEAFWHKYVVPVIPPPDTVGKLDTLKRIIRTPNKSVLVDDGIIVDYQQAKQMEKFMTDCRKRVEARLLTELGDAEEAVSKAGTYTYLEYNRKGHTVNPSTYRKLVRKKDD